MNRLIIYLNIKLTLGSADSLDKEKQKRMDRRMDIKLQASYSFKNHINTFLDISFVWKLELVPLLTKMSLPLADM